VGGIAAGDTYAGIENVYTGSGIDIVYGSAENNIINVGLGSNNTAYGEDGDDTLVGSDGQDDLHGGAGNDYLIGGHNTDFLTGDAGANTLQGGGGNDTYYVSTNSDTTLEFAAEGTDTVYAAFNVHTLQANVENLVSNQGFSFLGIGNALDNVITGTSARDDLYGRDGNDTLNDGGGGVGQEDTLIGGLGDDIYNVSVRGDSTIELAGQGTDTVRTAFSIYGLQANVENLTFTDNAAHAAGVGNELANVLRGGTGTDDLFGREGDDQLYGGTGSANTMLGQEGNDYYVVEAVGDSVFEFAAQGYDTVEAHVASYTLPANVEQLQFAGVSAVTAIGNAGANTILGTIGVDFISGLDGNDILTSGSGADTVLGGNGSDTFRYEIGHSGMDRVLDFVSGQDKISLIGFAQTASVSFVQGGAPAPTNANSTVMYNFNSGIVSYDADGNGSGAAVQITQLNAGLTLAAADFIFF
jgi:Ca2+-binding RTX toxin-like protein